MENFKQKFYDCSAKSERIFNLTSVPSEIIAPDLTILKANAAFADLLGFQQSELPDTSILAYTSEEHQVHWLNLQNELWDNDVDEFIFETCLIKKDKTRVWVKVTTIFFNEDGDSYGYSVFENLNKSQSTEGKLNLNEHWLFRVLETMAEGVGIIDKDGKVTYANSMARKILGYPADMPVHKHYGLFWKIKNNNGLTLPFDDHPMTRLLVGRKALFGQNIMIESINGEIKHISLNAAPLIDEYGKIIGGIGTFMDITPKRQLELLKDEFITRASHELNTPITSLQAALQLLKRRKHNSTDPKMPLLIDQANKTLNFLTVLISDLLQATKMGEGKLNLRPTHFKLAGLIADCCYHIRLNDEYTLRTEGETDLTAYADADRIDQVLTNFISNAIKYASGSKVIRILIEDLGNAVKVSVIDSGPGIAADKTEHLFDKYYGIDLQGKHFSGIGLGLYLSSEIIKMHNGTIGVESVLNQGSSFWFTLPKLLENY